MYKIEFDPIAVEAVAKVCHEANRAYCSILGDNSQKPWEEAEEWQKKSAIAGVHFRLSNPGISPAYQHEQWMKDKIADGWKYGPEKNPELKEHHCLVPYDQLPSTQQVKDQLFIAVVEAMRETVEIP